MSDESTPRRGKGTVFVKAEVCKGCAYCIQFCPTKCLSFSRHYNAKGYHYPELVRPDDCTGCDLCGHYCPDFAIFGKRWKDLDGNGGSSGGGKSPGSDTGGGTTG
jgi:2-oxoglutarate ferredoxin oxidoreductase subunit delta